MRRALAVGLLAGLALARPAGAQTTSLPIGYLGLDHDPRHAELRTYANIIFREAIDPYQGAETALDEARIVGRAAGLSFALVRAQAEDADALPAAVNRLARQGVRLALIDAPTEIVRAAVRPAAEAGMTLFNVSNDDDEMRGASCAANLMHVAPSLAMLTDALAQHAAQHRWKEILVLRGPEPIDRQKTESFSRSAKRFGLTIEATRDFVNSHDPRQRERNNVGLLTADADYDLIFVADASGELGRHLAYRSVRPRPVIGDEGLVASAWHWSWERHGAPQLNRRFERLAHRHMTDDDWAAWAATILIVRAAAAEHTTDPRRILARLKAPDLTFDTYKGSPGSFRPWDNQLRQPILLHTADAVAATAPEEGFLHPKQNLDTLGVDQPETRCGMEAAAR